MDLTTLAGDDTEANVHRLALKARFPVQQDLVKALGVEDKHITGATAFAALRYMSHALQSAPSACIPTV